MRLRRAGPSDAKLLEAVAAEAFEGYRSFAPAGWAPPPRGSEIITTIGERLRRPDDVVHARGDRRRSRRPRRLPCLGADPRPDPAPELTHLWHLFVRPPHWGSGLATRLHALAVEAATDQGYTMMRLHTPSAQARARRFYEREGRQATGTQAADAVLGLETVEYRRRLP